MAQSRPLGPYSPALPLLPWQPQRQEVLNPVFAALRVLWERWVCSDPTAVSAWESWHRLSRYPIGESFSASDPSLWRVLVCNRACLFC